MSRFEDLAQQLADLNLEIRHKMEEAEAKVLRVNGLIDELGKTGLLSREVRLGEVIEIPYDPESGMLDSGLVIQAALLVPEGFGVCLWDSEEYIASKADSEGLEPVARMKFIPFEQCEPAWKAFLWPHVDEMLEELVEIALVAASQMEPEPSLSAEDYFRERGAGEGSLS